MTPMGTCWRACSTEVSPASRLAAVLLGDRRSSRSARRGGDALCDELPADEAVPKGLGTPGGFAPGVVCPYPGPREALLDPADHPAGAGPPSRGTVTDHDHEAERAGGVKGA